MSILSIEDLSKRYGSVQALKNVSFTVPKGSVFGILGPNGSGKTTLLGTIMDILKPTSGTFRLFDEVPEVLSDCKILNFNKEAFIADLRTWIDGSGWR